MKINYTSGSWKIEEYFWEGEHTQEIHSIVDDIVICTSIRSEENARLIVAAPEMIEYLIELSRYHVITENYYNEKLYSIIKKVKGKSIEEILHEN